MTRARFLELLEEGPVVFDGAMGTQLYERGGAPNRSFDEMSVSASPLVEAVHRDYLAVGVDVIQTNSYGANRFALQPHGFSDRVVEICAASVATAKAAVAKAAAKGTRGGRAALIAGDVGPSGLLPKDLMRGRTRRQVFEAFREQQQALVAAGVDLLVFETFGFLGELEIAVEAAYGLDVPIVAQARFGHTGTADQTDDGASPEEVVARLVELGVDVVGANCCLGPEALLDVVARMVALQREGRGRPVIMQPNAGAPRVVDGRTLFSSPETYGVVARRAFKLGVACVGGCCGTGPEHLRRVVAAARMVGGGRAQSQALSSTSSTSTASSSSAGLVEVLRAAGEPPVPFAERSRLAGKMARGEFVVSVELSPPVGLDADKTLAKIAALQAGGVDAVNIPDGPRATVRMSNQALARIVVDKFDRIEPILHVCGRDRNLLALQGDLIGAHVSGIRNTVIITGDPPKVGDYPDATAVFDLDSIGILGVAAGLNRGLDPTGKTVGGQTRFVLIAGAEPAAVDVERELARLKEKRDAGAEVVMTQPVFDPATLLGFLDRVRPLGLKVVVGILPLASSKNAEFLHKNVPGMRIPDDVRARMAAAGEGRAAAEGVVIAAEALREIRRIGGGQVAGAYFMPPFGKVELAIDVLARL
ncbi:MAG: bifunctional homocysteine S-methyltransferase/methylenetetrahydrofolate reductase [Deltaproteobacteria bacterium]|nr:bifunctional homocysteine S-methyltransferase/methylenetetrahydrofolate reductase [Deltaproteobacteria bacterium]